MKSHTNFKSSTQDAGDSIHTPGAGNFTSHAPFALRESRACALLGFFHTTLLGLSVCAAVSSFCDLTGTAYVFSLVLFAFFILSTDILSRTLAHKIRHLLLYFFIGFLYAGLLTAAGGYLAARFWGIRNAFSLVVCIVSVFIIVTHARACTKSGEITVEYIATHDFDIPYRMARRELPTILTAPGVRCISFFAICYVIGLIGKRPLLWRSEFYLALCDLFVCAAYRYIHNFTVFLQDNHALANLPVRTIRRVHIMLFFIGVLLLILFSVPAILYGREPLSELTLSVSRDLSETDTSSMEFAPSAATDDFSFLEDLSDVGPVYTPPKWLSDLMHWLLILIIILLAICAFIGLLHAIHLAMKHFAASDEDDVLFLWDETLDTPAAVLHESDREDGFFSVNRKIRRLYKKTIRKSTSGTPDRSATPTELEAHAGLLGTDEMAVLHEVYEKARYSKDGASAEDAARISS